MRKMNRVLIGIAIVSLVTSTLAATAWLLAPNTSANGESSEGQSDHSLLDARIGERVYCGVGKKIEPWTLHVSASTAIAGTLTIMFRDGDTVGFSILAGDSFSLTQSMGGVPGVDDLVRVTLSSGGAWVSASAREGARDPFVEPVPEKDNFCIGVVAFGEQEPDTVGVTLGVSPFTGTVLPAAWDGNGNGKLD